MKVLHPHCFIYELGYVDLSRTVFCFKENKYSRINKFLKITNILTFFIKNVLIINMNEMNLTV